MNAFPPQILLIVLLLASCSPGKDKTPPDPPAPAPPEGRDFTKPGGHGTLGIDPYDEEKPNKDVPFADWDSEGALLGSSLFARVLWDKKQKLNRCPDDPIYVYAATYASSKPQCADGKGFAGICRSARKKAFARAVNVVRSCEAVPGCKATISGLGQKWSCNSSRSYLGVDKNGNDILGPPRWEKDCLVQYKVVCLSL